MLLQKDVVNLHLLVESDDHLIFLVTIPIHDGSNESSEISSETSSGTHPHKVLGQAKLQRQAWGHPYNRDQAKNIYFAI